MKVKIPKEVLYEHLWGCDDKRKAEALKCDEYGFLELEFEWNCVSDISDSEIDDLNDKFMWLNYSVIDYTKHLTESEKIELIQELKEQVCDAYAKEDDFFLEFFNERFDYEQKQAIIKKLIEHNPSVEQTQELVKNLKAHNESDSKIGKDEQ